MEAVNSLAGAAAKAVWGSEDKKQHGDEPVSGQTGDVSKGEPYDAGNIEKSPEQESKESEGDASAKFAQTTGTAASTTDGPQTDGAALKAERDVPADSTAGQNDTRDPSNPQTNPKDAPTDVNNVEAPSAADDDEAAVKPAQDLDKIPGPRDLAEVAREGGGDAGQAGKPAKEEKTEAGDAEEDNKEKGDGTQYVKSSGLQADGGDFDATNPGAGREAERLMEEKGMTNPAAAAKDSSGKPAEDQSMTSKNSGSSGDSPGKKGLRQKIKDKLGRN